jgi:type I restriction enzyme R subunit
MSPTPEEKARQTIDGLLEQAGWIVQDRDQANIDAGPGVAIREFALGHGHGEADYLLFVDGQAAGAIEAKKEGSTKVRWELADQDVPYVSDDLDRRVVTPDQIRTIVRAFRDNLFTDIFPGRIEVPKTLIFAKDDSHAEDIIQIIREEFGKGNDFAQKITYRSGAAKVRVKKTDKEGNEYEVDEWVSGNLKPEQLLNEFRTGYNPRIAVTVDMIATGTDIKPLEIVMFMRSVKSRTMRICP